MNKIIFSLGLIFFFLPNSYCQNIEGEIVIGEVYGLKIEFVERLDETKVKCGVGFITTDVKVLYKVLVKNVIFSSSRI